MRQCNNETMQPCNNVTMKHIILLFIFCVNVPLLAQDESPILLDNPDFEGQPSPSQSPSAWLNCGAAGETPPDILPHADFEVTKKAAEGQTYMGLVVRDNDTWEAVSQQLKVTIQPNQCYEFSLSLSRSKQYKSLSRRTEKETNYTTPAKIRIWAGNSACEMKQLLDETALIISTRWLKYDFRFEPKESYQYIIIQAFFKTPTLFPYNGHVLVDNASAIIPVPCNNPITLDIADFEVEEPSPNEKVVETVTPEPPPTAATEPPPLAYTKSKPIKKPKKQETLGGYKRKDIKKGQTIKLERLFFEADKATVKAASNGELNNLYHFLNKNTDLIIEIGGHTNSTPSHEYCDKLSGKRAKAIADYLEEKGIDAQRLKYKGYGKRKPIASNKTAAGRKRNQRVEIKILGFK